MSIARRTLRITKKLIKLAFVLLIVFINALLIWRLFSTSEPKTMKALSPNEALVSAYLESGEALGAFRQEQRTITSAEGNYGYFSVTKATFIPSANQIQVVFRYNNSTLRHTQEDFSLDEAPSRDDDVYDVSLLVVTDLTPDNDDDNLSTSSESVKMSRIKPTYSESDKTSLYNYRLLVFDLDELDLASLVQDETLISVFADVYYSGAVDYEEKPYGTLCLYDYKTATEPVKLSKDDIDAIEGRIS